MATSEHWLHKNRLNVLDDISTAHNYMARSSKFSSSESYGSTRGRVELLYFGVRVYLASRLLAI